MTTPVYGWPYELLSQPPDGASLGEDLSLAIEDDVARIDALLAAVITESAGTAPIATAWTDWTPASTWTAASVNPALGNGSQAGRYKLVGDFCWFTAVLLFGSSTTYGSGIYGFGIPPGVTAKAGASGVSSVTFGIRDNSSAVHAAGFGNIANGASSMDCRVVGGNQASPTVPYTLAQNDFIRYWGYVEKL